MIDFNTPHRKIHQGKNVKRFREMLGIKQEALALSLGEDWSPKRVSLMEQKESIESNILEQVAAIFKIPVEAIENLDEEQAVNIIANTFHTNDNATVGIGGNISNGGNSSNGNADNRIFHPIDKLVQLHEEKITLYERMLKEKDDIIDRLEKLIERNNEF